MEQNLDVPNKTFFAFHRVQKLSVSRCEKARKEGKRPAWQSQDLLVKLKGKNDMHRQ